MAKGSATHNMAYGGSRSGKSFIWVRNIFIRASKIKSRHIVFRLKFNHVKTSIWMETIPKVLELCFPDLGATPNKSDYFYRLPNGSEVWVAGLDDKDRTEKVLGKEYSTIFFNECSQIPLTSVNMALTRLAEKNNLKKKVYYDQNPPSKKHWAYWQFEKNFDPLAEEPVDPDDYCSILMNPKDNMANIDENYIKLLEKMPKKDRDRFLLGVYGDSDDGQAYYEFDRDKHVESVKRTPGTIFIGMDFNVDPMTAVIFQLVDGTFNIIDEVFLRNSDTPKMCKELREKGYTGLQVIPDSTGRNRKTSGKSDFQMLRDEGFQIVPTHNPYVNDRVNNVNRLLATNRIKIDKSCKKLINDLEKVSWVDNKLNQKGEDKLLTHISDCLGYGCWKLEPIGIDTRPSRQIIL